ncbi:MAG: hypothetical protein LIP01_08905 [Tannerellaceae bacterium]|nr:hypothetical protein [Tannerellaceae bacterium]
MKQESKVYHIELIDPVKGEKHFYFGSQAAIYDKFSSEQLGITYNYLRSKINLDEAPYINDKCTIRLGKLRRKENKK